VILILIFNHFFSNRGVAISIS